MGDFNSILLKRQFEVPLDIEILVTSLSSKHDDDFTVRKINEYNFDVIAYSSFGILRGPFGQVTDGIKVYVNFAPGHEKKTLVTLGTNFRIELYFAIFISLCLGMAGALNQIFPFWAYFFFPFMICFFGLFTEFKKIHWRMMLRIISPNNHEWVGRILNNHVYR